MFETKSATTENHQVWQLITELQQERSQVWGLYCRIAELKPALATHEIRPLLNDFLQRLIDYVSLGHFGVYEYLLSNPGQANKWPDAERLYPAFSATTKSVVTFNERYDSGLRRFSLDALVADLSLLGEQLAQRMELEDRLCSILLH